MDPDVALAMVVRLAVPVYGTGFAGGDGGLDGWLAGDCGRVCLPGDLESVIAGLDGWLARGGFAPDMAVLSDGDLDVVLAAAADAMPAGGLPPGSLLDLALAEFSARRR